MSEIEEKRPSLQRNWQQVTDQLRARKIVEALVHRQDAASRKLVAELTERL